MMARIFNRLGIAWCALVLLITLITMLVENRVEPGGIAVIGGICAIPGLLCFVLAWIFVPKE
jgi:hypothetical protein